MDGDLRFLASSDQRRVQTPPAVQTMAPCSDDSPVQMRALARAKIQWSDERVLRLPLEADLEYSRFGLTPEEIGIQSWTDPVSGDLGMLRSTGIKIPLLEFDISTALSCDIGQACSATGRSQRWSILEWLMLNPEFLKKFFVRMAEEIGFRRFYTNLYDLLRLCHLRIFDEKAPKIEAVDDALNKAVVLNLEAERKGLEVDEAQVLIRKKRVSWLEGLSTDWELKKRTRWRDVVPGVKTKLRSGLKRSRSKSKIKPGKTERMRKNACLAKDDSAVAEGSGIPSGSALSQPGSGLPETGKGLGAMDDGREDVVILDDC